MCVNNLFVMHMIIMRRIQLVITLIDKILFLVHDIDDTVTVVQSFTRVNDSFEGKVWL